MNDYLIYSVEDDEGIATIINIALTKSLFKVKTFDSGETFLEEFKKTKPNLVLLDLMLPGIQGEEVLKEIRKYSSEIPIIILSAKSLIEDKVSMLNIGADDYMVKPFNIKELISRVNVNYRKFLANKFIIKISPFTLDQKNEILYRYDQKIDLTNNEYKIIKYLFNNRGKIVSRDELYKVIWGKDDKNISSRTVDMHIKSIREKILDNDKTFIISVYGNGYKIE
ncbi:MAG: response regulator transcription factor [Firmicutes bacterium]|uniref:Response regulator transcription factor n=1 Tax=Candidatus Onthovivens merdipullorum TaxID=2840889 RepID=A0A9D9DH64_9BACL|nr:response regulator transcription factor [Candidatus Onthovivens merdipullorum]